MVLIGLSWLVCWLLVQVFTLELLKAILITGLLFFIIGLVFEHPWTTWHKP